MLNQFNQHVNNLNNSNKMFSQNAMFNQNPNTSLKDSNFYNKIQMAKLEQIKRAKKIEDMGMTKKELYEHIIDPHKIEKTSKQEIDKDLNKIEGMYVIDKTSQSNDFLKDLWRKRTNNPYKNVIKKELFENNYKKYYKDNIFKKDISDKKELMVHKVIKDIDADELLLENEFELLNGILEKHNNELKSIYSVSNKTQFKKDFEYAQKYKYRLEYNPKDAEELKDFYKKEQKKINKENKMLDEIIDILVEQEELSKEEVDALNNKLEEVNKVKLSDNLNNNKESIITNDKYTENDLERELRREFGDDYDDIMKALDDDDTDTKNNEDNKDIKITSKVKITSKSIIKNKPTITSKNIIKPKENNSIEDKEEKSSNSSFSGEISTSLKDLYKNRKK